MTQREKDLEMLHDEMERRDVTDVVYSETADHVPEVEFIEHGLQKTMWCHNRTVDVCVEIEPEKILSLPEKPAEWTNDDLQEIYISYFDERYNTKQKVHHLTHLQAMTVIKSWGKFDAPTFLS